MGGVSRQIKLNVLFYIIRCIILCIMSFHISSLSKEQQYAFERFKKGENLFITGAGGTGKTHLIHTLIEYAKLTDQKYQVCAMTGCAAVLLNCGARTLHSWSGIKGAKGSLFDVVNSVLDNNFAVSVWKEIDILIVDEVSMMSEKIFEILCEIAEQSRGIPVFGGIQVIFTGDFFQLPPVGSSTDESTSRFCFQSAQWFDVFSIENHIELRAVFRQTDPVYCDILSQIRKGTLDESSCEILKGCLNRNHVGQKPTKLFATRAQTDYTNRIMFDKLEGDIVAISCIRKTDFKQCVKTGESFSKLQKADCEKFDKMKPAQKTQLLEYFIANTKCEPTLSLKRGSVVMCTVNFDLDQNICNGSQGVVVDFCPSAVKGIIPIVRFTNGAVVKMGYHYWQSEEYPCLVVGQCPLCLAWALTIHKIQGSTLNLAEIDIGNSIFEYGQTYVALSRVKSLDGLYLSAFNPHRIKSNPVVKQFYSLMDQQGDILIDTWWNTLQKKGDGEGAVDEGVVDEEAVGGCENRFSQYKYSEEKYKVIETTEPPLPFTPILDGNVKQVSLTKGIMDIRHFMGGRNTIKRV